MNEEAVDEDDGGQSDNDVRFGWLHHGLVLDCDEPEEFLELMLWPQGTNVMASRDKSCRIIIGLGS